MARNLVDMGYRVTVLTASEPGSHLSSWETDLSGIEIIRVPMAKVPKEYGWAYRLMFRAFWATKGIPIIEKLVRTISFFFLPMDHHMMLDLTSDKRIEKLNPTVIIATGGPWSIFEIGRTLSRRIGAELYLDYRDAWNIYSPDLRIGLLHDLGSGILGRIKCWSNKRRERAIGRHAKGIISVSENTLNNCMVASGVNNSCLVLNGYGHEPLDSVEPLSSKMNLTFTGTIHKEQLFDIFIKGVEILRSQHPNIFEDLQFNLIGVLSSYPSNIDALSVFSNNPQFNIKPYIDLNESIRIQRSSDVLISIATRGLVGIPGSKLFEYFKAERPILLISLADDGQESLLEETNTGSICRSAKEVSDLIVQYHSEWRSNHGIEYAPNYNAVQRYSYKEQMKKLALFIDPEMKTSQHYPH